MSGQARLATNHGYLKIQPYIVNENMCLTQDFMKSSHESNFYLSSIPTATNATTSAETLPTTNSIPGMQVFHKLSSRPHPSPILAATLNKYGNHHVVDVSSETVKQTSTIVDSVPSCMVADKSNVPSKSFIQIETCSSPSIDNMVDFPPSPISSAFADFQSLQHYSSINLDCPSANLSLSTANSGLDHCMDGGDCLPNCNNCSLGLDDEETDLVPNELIQFVSESTRHIPGDLVDVSVADSEIEELDHEARLASLCIPILHPSLNGQLDGNSQLQTLSPDPTVCSVSSFERMDISSQTGFTKCYLDDSDCYNNTVKTNSIFSEGVDPTYHSTIFDSKPQILSNMKYQNSNSPDHEEITVPLPSDDFGAFTNSDGKTMDYSCSSSSSSSSSSTSLSMRSSVVPRDITNGVSVESSIPSNFTLTGSDSVSTCSIPSICSNSSMEINCSNGISSMLNFLCSGNTVTNQSNGTGDCEKESIITLQTEKFATDSPDLQSINQTVSFVEASAISGLNLNSITNSTSGPIMDHYQTQVLSTTHESMSLSPNLVQDPDCNTPVVKMANKRRQVMLSNIKSALTTTSLIGLSTSSSSSSSVNVNGYEQTTTNVQQSSLSHPLVLTSSGFQVVSQSNQQHSMSPTILLQNVSNPLVIPSSDFQCNSFILPMKNKADVANPTNSSSNSCLISSTVTPTQLSTTANSNCFVFPIQLLNSLPTTIRPGMSILFNIKNGTPLKQNTTTLDMSGLTSLNGITSQTAVTVTAINTVTTTMSISNTTNNITNNMSSNYINDCGTNSSSTVFLSNTNMIPNVISAASNLNIPIIQLPVQQRFNLLPSNLTTQTNSNTYLNSSSILNGNSDNATTNNNSNNNNNLDVKQSVPSAVPLPIGAHLFILRSTKSNAINSGLMNYSIATTQVNTDCSSVSLYTPSFIATTSATTAVPATTIATSTSTTTSATATTTTASTVVVTATTKPTTTSSSSSSSSSASMGFTVLLANPMTKSPRSGSNNILVLPNVSSSKSNVFSFNPTTVDNFSTVSSNMVTSPCWSSLNTVANHQINKSQLSVDLNAITTPNKVTGNSCIISQPTENLNTGPLPFPLTLLPSLVTQTLILPSTTLASFSSATTNILTSNINTPSFLSPSATLSTSSMSSSSCLSFDNSLPSPPISCVNNVEIVKPNQNPSSTPIVIPLCSQLSAITANGDVMNLENGTNCVSSENQTESKKNVIVLPSADKILSSPRLYPQLSTIAPLQNGKISDSKCHRLSYSGSITNPIISTNSTVPSSTVSPLVQPPITSTSITTSFRRRHQCPYCPKSCERKDNLQAHIRTHTGERPYPCRYCPKAFPQKDHLRAHIRTHTGEKPYRCPQCLKAFAQLGNLHRHVKTHRR